MTEVHVRWEAPRVAENAAGIYYNLKYNSIDGDVHEGEVNETMATDTVVGDLHMDQTYEFRAQIVSDLGFSDFSKPQVVKTESDETDLIQFEHKVMEILDELKKEADRKTAFCASKSKWTDTGTITFDKVFLNNSNIDDTNLDANSGIFVAGAAGSYLVTASMEMRMISGQSHKIWIEQNGDKESEMGSKCDEFSWGNSDNGSKDIVLELAKGDEVKLVHETTGDTHLADPEDIILANIVFCVRSLKVK